MDQQMLNVIVGIVVISLVAVSVFEAGRKTGENGILKKLETANSSKPTLDAIEGLVQSVPGDVAERIIGKLVEGYVALRPFVPGETLKSIGDVAAEIGVKISDGKPNEVAVSGDQAFG